MIDMIDNNDQSKEYLALVLRVRSVGCIWSVSGFGCVTQTRDKARAEEHFFSRNIYKIWAQLRLN